MRLRYITCSDPREFNDIHDIVNLGQISPRAEIAVQAHPSKMSAGMPRNQWFNELLDYVVSDLIDIDLAVHVNREWCAEICKTGEIPMELRRFFYERKSLGWPVIKRWQLNMSENVAEKINVRALKKLFDCESDHDFIVQYNDNTEYAVKKLYDAHARFSVLYDASGGRGLEPTYWAEPVFKDRAQGYSGGMSPENVADNLDKISSVVPANHSMWIDAEGKLKTDDKFDIARAKQYIINAESWLKRQR